MIRSEAQARRAAKRVGLKARKSRRLRKDFLHKTSSKLAKECGLIVVGDVSSSKLAQTSMAKSVLDAD